MPTVREAIFKARDLAGIEFTTLRLRLTKIASHVIETIGRRREVKVTTLTWRACALPSPLPAHKLTRSKACPARSSHSDRDYRAICPARPPRPLKCVYNEPDRHTVEKLNDDARPRSNKGKTVINTPALMNKVS